MHVARERHRREKDAQADGIGPPERLKIKTVAEDEMKEVVHPESEETSSAEVGGEALGQKPQGENQPEAVEGYPVRSGWPGGMLHSEDYGPEALENGQGYAGQDIEQEEVHQEEKERAPEGFMSRIYPDEISVENRIEEAAGPRAEMLRQEKGHLDVAEHYEHEPAEGYSRMHVAE